MLNEQYFYFTYSKESDSILKEVELLQKQGIISRIFILGDINQCQFYISLLQEFPCIDVAHTKHVNYKDCNIIVQVCQVEKHEYIDGGVHLEGDGVRQLLVSNIQHDGVEGMSTSFKSVDILLKKYNFEGKNIVRFWNYLQQVLRYYEDFNQVRNSYFDNWHIQNYPAATGIESQYKDQALLHMSFDAVQGDNIQVRTISSDMQCEAYDYGPRFSRGKCIEFKDGSKKIYVSGTSTVDLEGSSILKQDSQKNVEYVLESVEHLLQKEKVNMNSFAMTIVYCKSEQFFNVFEDIYKKMGYTFKYAPVFVDICRDDFYFEMEGVALQFSANSK